VGQADKLMPIALIVEDDPDLRELAAALLEETDLKVVECATAEEALVTMCTHGNEVALIFADIRLPGLIDGIDLARKARALWPRVRIIVTSGNPGNRIDALPENAIYMQKPWRALEVLMEAERAAASALGEQGQLRS
jgi:CheY-like chemotaxis protein